MYIHTVQVTASAYPQHITFAHTVCTHCRTSFPLFPVERRQYLSLRFGKSIVNVFPTYPISLLPLEHRQCTFFSLFYP